MVATHSETLKHNQRSMHLQTHTQRHTTAYLQHCVVRHCVAALLLQADHLAAQRNVLLREGVHARRQLLTLRLKALACMKGGGEAT